MIKAVRQIKDHRIGYCPFCCEYTLFLRIGKGTRENYICIKCRSWSRKRHIARLLCKVLQVDSLVELTRLSVSIYNTDPESFLNKFLLKNPNYTRSVYVPEGNGKLLNKGLYSQDLQKLSFDKETFDIVLTEDVLEHVRHYELAIKEINRVLKVGGFHIFTVPINLESPDMITRIDTSREEDVYLLPKEYHGDGSRNGKIISYRTFGCNIIELLRNYGFETNIYLSTKEDQKYGIYGSSVLVSKKC